MSEAIRVYLVDDHRVVRAGLRSILAEYPSIEVVGEGATPCEALQEIQRLQPHVVLLDIRLGQEDGCDLCGKLKKLSVPPRVLMLTSCADEEVFLRALNSGADGYILKDTREAALAAAISAVFEGGMVWGRFATQLLKARITPDAASEVRSRLDQLTPTERRVLALLADGKTNKEIAAELKFSEKSVRYQVSVLMGKLGVERRPQAAAYFVKFSK